MNMKKLKVNLVHKHNDSYEIIIGKNLLQKIPKLVQKNLKPTKVGIIADSRTKNLFGKKLLKLFRKAGIPAVLISFPAGEKSKNLRTVETLSEKLVEKGLDRKSLVVALGGGVVGDVAGFAAAAYMRGVPFIQVPTTLLAMVDSSVGGKVGVDLKAGKNLVGAFAQPKAVFIDLSVLKTLPKRELRNGLTEAVKTAVIADRKLFSFMERNTSRIKKVDLAVMEKIVKRCCEIKAKVVEKDEKEQNLRRILNYGHTFGHALESATRYKKFSHGEAVALGMQIEGKLSNSLGIFSQGDLERQNKLIAKLQLAPRMPELTKNKIIGLMRKDKKAVAKEIRFSFPKRIGKMHSVKGSFVVAVAAAKIRRVLK